VGAAGLLATVQAPAARGPAVSGSGPLARAADGAAAESFFATLKTEIGTGGWPDRASARRDIENWIKFYDERRLNSALGYQPPAETRCAWDDRMATAT